MLIISKFHDYYDSAISSGVDKTVVFRRKEQELESPHKDYSIYPNKIELKKIHRGRYFNIILAQFKIGFCGKMYYGVHSYAYTNFLKAPKINYIYDRKELDKLIEGYNPCFWELKKLNTLRFDIVNCPQMIKDKKIILFCGSVMQEQKRYGSHRSTYHVPKVFENIKLKDKGFVRVLDPYTAFQEIYMYISGVIGTGQKEPITISDRDMRDAKGFNKFSFKHPVKLRDIK